MNDTATPAFRAPAAHPVSVIMETVAVLDYATISTNWRLSEAGSSYSLYATDNFAGMPPKGDLLGIVQQLVAKARLGDSGVVLIGVQSHGATIKFSEATTVDHRARLVRAAILTAGYPVTIKG